MNYEITKADIMPKQINRNGHNKPKAIKKHKKDKRTSKIYKMQGRQHAIRTLSHLNLFADDCKKKVKEEWQKEGTIIRVWTSKKNNNIHDFSSI